MTVTKLEYRVGVVVLTGMIILAYMIIKFSDTNVFHETYNVTAVFKEVNGVVIGAPVWSSGVEIGKVSDIKLLSRPVQQVHLILSVGQDVVLRDDMKVLITSLGIMGEKVVEFQPTRNEGKPLDDGDVIQGISPTALTTVIDETRLILGKVNTALDELLDEETRKDIKDSLKNFRSLTANFDTAVLSTQEILDENRENIRETLVHARSGSERFSTFFETAGNIAQTINNGNGFLGKIVTNEELYKQLLELITGLNEYGIFYKKKKPTRATRPTRRERYNRGYIFTKTS